MTSELCVIVPTRGRPANITKVISAWDFTSAWDDADLMLVVDADDPEIENYRGLFESTRHPDTDEPLFSMAIMDTWLPMVHKLDKVAGSVALSRRYRAIGFAGDDHLPRTIGWAKRYLTVLAELGTGMVFGDDGYQGRNLSTEWAVTADYVRELGRMIPAPVEHMYCDNAIMETFAQAGALRHLPEVRIEHMHPIAGKGDTDAQYRRVNSSEQFKRDRRAYEAWRDGTGRLEAVALIRHLRGDLPDVELVPGGTGRKPPRAFSQPRSVPPRPRREAASRMAARYPWPRHFRNVRAATPDNVMITLADLAAQVPGDQEIVELGVFHGRTALTMAWGAKTYGQGAHVTGIDPWDLPGNVYDPPFNESGSRSWARHHVQSLGYSSQIRLIQDFSLNASANWSGPKVGLLFVDGDHTKEGARRDIEAWVPHLAPDAVIAVDDYGHPDWPGVREAVDELVAEGFLKPVAVYHDRLAVTGLANPEQYAPDGVIHPPVNIMAITSEGVAPSPYPAAEGQVAVDASVSMLPQAPVATEPGCQHPQCVLDHPHAGPAVLGPTINPADLEDGSGEDSENDLLAELDAQAVDNPVDNSVVRAGELDDIEPGTDIETLNLVHLKALSKARGIVLGVRKDKRDLIVQALIEGK